MNERIIFKHPDEDLVMVFLEAGIGGTRERIYVAGLVLSHIRNTRDIIPMVSEHRGVALASRCLVSLGFFRAYMNHLNIFHGYPSPDFYMKQGKTAFKSAGEEEVSEHLGDWTCFIQDSFRLKHESEGVVAASSYSTSREHKSYGNEDSKVWKGLGRLSRGYDCGDLQQAAFN